MIRNFNSFLDFASHLAARAAAIEEELHHELKQLAEHIEKTAKDEIGVYQAAAGPFPAWPELADATKEDRLRQGYTENDPLLRSGGLRDSISHQVEGHEALIGSTDEKMVFHEFGTSRIPARPVLGPALVRNLPALEKLMAAAIRAGLIDEPLDRS
jgi:phage gpG-like protein